jgi:hypothetical protein
MNDQYKFFIILLSIFFTISTGCLTQHDTGAQEPTISQTQTTATIQPANTPNQSQCQPRQNETLRIRINPIPPQYDGETFTLSGTTNIKVGKEIVVYAVPEPDGSWPGYYYIPPTTTVIFGSCDTNTWSMNISTIIYSHRYGEKTVSVWAVDNDHVSAATTFILLEGSRESVKKRKIP